jgi:hypothetical protein
MNREERFNSAPSACAFGDNSSAHPGPAEEGATPGLLPPLRRARQGPRARYEKGKADEAVSTACLPGRVGRSMSREP